MLDIKRVRENFDEVVKRIESRGHGDYGLKEIKLLDEKRRSALAEVENKKNRQKTSLNLKKREKILLSLWRK